MPDPRYDDKIKKFALIVDGNDIKEEQKPVLEHIISLFDFAGLSYVDYVLVPLEHLKGPHQEARDNVKKEFDEEWCKFGKSIDIDMLMRYAQDENPALYEALQRKPLNLREVLWAETQRVFDQPESIHYSAFSKILYKVTTEIFPETHLAFPLLNINLMTALGSRNGFSYHTVGRGLYSFGTIMPIRIGEDPPPYPFTIFLGVNAVKDQDIKTQKLFLSEVFYHEFRGHLIGGLPDHHTKEGGSCIMTTRHSVPEVIESAKSRGKEDYFCESCRQNMEER